MGWTPEVTSTDLGDSSVSIPSPAPRTGVGVRVTFVSKLSRVVIFLTNENAPQNFYRKTAQVPHSSDSSGLLFTDCGAPRLLTSHTPFHSEADPPRPA